MSANHQKPSLFFKGFHAMFEALHFDYFSDTFFCQPGYVKKFGGNNRHVPVDTLGDQDDIGHRLLREGVLQIM